jgi:hypothetical protein
VYDASCSALSFYLDHALFERFEGVAFTTADKWLFFGTKEGGIGHENEAWMGVNGALYDELRITKRALKPTEFITPESIAGANPTMHARFENVWAATAAGRYALVGTPSASGVAFASSAKPAHEILNASHVKLFDNARGTAFTGGTVTYPANGVLDLDAGMAECFVKIEGGTASDTVILFAQANDPSMPIWRLNANGSYLVQTDNDTLSGGVSLGAGQWHHFAVAWAPNGADTDVTVFWDHAVAASQTLSGVFNFGTGAGITLGSAGFSGRIDELRVREGVLGTADQLYFFPAATVLYIR